MPRNKPGRYPRDPVEEDEVDAMVVVRNDMLHVHRGASHAQHSNHVRKLDWYYAFLARMEGPGYGPWITVFECTGQQWMNEAIEHLTKLNQLIAILAQFSDFESAWNAAIANRVALRHIRDAYDQFLKILAEEEGGLGPPQLATFETQLFEWDLDHHGFTGPLTPGRWYALGLRPAGNQEEADAGLFRNQDPRTKELNAPKCCVIGALSKLAPSPTRRAMKDKGDFHALSTVTALHSRRIEV